MSIVIDFGEARHIRLEICNIYNQDFTIKKCDFELKNQTGQIESTGQADIINHIIDVLIEPKSCGDYDLKFTYYIADEILIEHVKVAVI